jgi:hypothetical protein
MNEEVETFTLDGMRVSVEETPDALTYTFAPQRRHPMAPSPVGFVFVLVLVPLGYLALVVYAHSKIANRPEWEDFLTGVFAGQMLAWLVTGAAQCYQILRQSYRPYGIILQFTRTYLHHAGRRVCELEEVRGLRLFVYTAPVRPRVGEPAPSEEPPKTEACLSLVIGEEVPSAKPDGFGGTHGLFGAFDAAPLRELAEHIHRRLAAFRPNQGIMAPLDALSVVETTESDAYDWMHTLPAKGTYGGFSFAALLLLQNRWLGIGWSVAMFAGLYATMRVIAAAGLGQPFILPHCLLGVVHFFLLVIHINGPEIPTKRPAAK